MRIIPPGFNTPTAFREHVQPLRIGNMFQLVLAENIVERIVFERKPSGSIQGDGLEGLGIKIGVEPARQDVLVCTKLQLSHRVAIPRSGY